MKNIQWHSLRTRITFLMLAIFLVSIWSLALYAINALHEDMRRQLGEQQFSTVTLAAAQIDNVLKDRLTALEKVAGLIDAPLLENPVALQKSLEGRPAFQSLFNGGTVATRLDGNAIAGVPLASGRLAPSAMSSEVIATALQEGKSTIGRPTHGTILNSPVFGMAVPVRDAQKRLIGALAGVIDLGLPNCLEQLTHDRYGKTGGYLLVAPQYRLIITATDKSHTMETYPAPGINPTLDRFIEGFEGSAVYVDSAGVEILASAKKIPVAGWLVVAMMPATEAFAPERSMRWRMLQATILLTLLAGVLIWWVLHRQLRPLISTASALASLADSKQPLAPLPNARQDEIGQVIFGFNRLLGDLAQREDALTKGDSFKKDILNSIAAEIVVLDRQGLIQAVNDRWQRFALENNPEPGKPLPNTEVGANYLAVCEADSDSTARGGRHASQGIRAVLNAHIGNFELEYPCNSPAQQRWFSMVVTPLGPNAAEGVVITHSDITARKQAVLALVASDELLNLFIQYAPAGLAMFDRNMCYLQASNRWLADYGLAGRDVLGLSHYDLLPEIPESWKEFHRRGLSGEVVRSEGDQFERLDGSQQWVRWEIRPWYTAQRDVGGIVIFAEEITQQKKAEQALVESEDRFNLFMETLPAAVFIKDRLGTIVYCNRFMEDILGTSAWAGKTAPAFFQPELAEDMIADDQLALEAGLVIGEEEVPDKDNRLRLYQTYKFRIHRQGQAPLLGGIAFDITEQKRTEREMVAAKAEADAANQAKSRFLAAASHDLRQPLAALSLYVGVLKSEISPEHVELLGNIQSCVDSLSELLNNLLDVSKLEAGVVTPSVRDFPIAELLNNVVSIHSAEAELKGLRLRLRSCAAFVRTDPTLLRRILGNLVANAIRYTNQGGVLIACRRHQGKLWVEVWDSGIGIAEDQIGIIFEEFRQLGNGARTRGSGLGLAIVAKTSRLLGLQLRMHSRPGHGSLFAIELPPGRSLGPAVDAPRTFAARSLRIGLVEDNARVLEALCLALENEGHEVVAATTGRDLIDRLGDRMPDILISDYRLTAGETGFMVIEAARARFGDELPAMLVTGDTDPGLIRTMTDQGIAVLYKPLQMETLRTCMRDVLERRSA